MDGLEPAALESLSTMELVQRVIAHHPAFPFALSRIDTARAATDLARLLHTATRVPTRRGAAIGLARVATPVAIASLAAAVRRGRIPPLRFAEALGADHRPPGSCHRWLTRGSDAERRFALAWIASSLRSPRKIDPSSLDPLRDAAASALARPDLGFLSRPLRAALEQWLARPR